MSSMLKVVGWRLASKENLDLLYKFNIHGNFWSVQSVQKRAKMSMFLARIKAFKPKKCGG